MYTLTRGSGSTGSEAKAPVTGTDPITGLTEAAVSASLPLGSGPGELSEQSGADSSSYFQLNGADPYGGSTLTTEFRPDRALDKLDVTEPSTTNPGQLGLVAHGALIDSLSSHDINGFIPTVSQPDVDTATPPPDIGVAAFPGALQRVVTVEDFSGAAPVPSERQQLDLVAGQFIPGPPSTPSAGTQRLFTSIGAEVF